jgi:hypothetical protein
MIFLTTYEGERDFQDSRLCLLTCNDGDVFKNLAFTPTESIYGPIRMGV